MKSFSSYLTSRNIATFILVLFCIQYIPIESREGVSYLKLAVSALCPFVLLIYSAKVSKMMIMFLIYYATIVISALLHPDTLRWSTVFFLATFIVTYLAFYNLVVIEEVFSKKYFRKILEGLILAYTIVLIIQQCFIIIGIRTFPLINLVQFLDRGIGANSLSYEPSSVAIILSFAMLSLIRIIELDYGRKLSFREIYTESKWPTVGFLWCMLSMGSGSAFIGLGILLCYFIRPRYYVSAILLIVIAYFAIMYIDFVPLQRARDSFLAFFTLDNKAVSEADGSAAARIIPMVNTLTKLDLTSFEGWFGHGVDYGLSKGLFSDIVMVGNIADYGFFGFIILQTIVYMGMIRKIFSIETLLWLGLGMATLANVPINWGAMMMFTAVRYFQIKNENECLDNNSKLQHKATVG